MIALRSSSGESSESSSESGGGVLTPQRGSEVARCCNGCQVSSSESERGRVWYLLSKLVFFCTAECGWGLGLGRGRFCQGFLLPLKGARPILLLFVIELRFPFASSILAGCAGMVLRVAANTIPIQYVIIQLLLQFAGDGVTINLSRQVGAFEAFGEDSGALMGRAFPFCVGLSLLFGGPGIQLAFVIRWGSGFWDLLGGGLGGILSGTRYRRVALPSCTVR
jgi:hypothetical protein